MKVGIIVTPNSKGQVVIPKQVRTALGIDTKVPLNLVLKEDGIYLYPIKEVVTNLESESSFAEILKRTAGAWRGDDWEKTRKRRREIELRATEKNKAEW